ncbi:MAG: 2-oxoacid:acceptor oxidoreductase, gamma subunit, pyruvate/2-ketoisovalerate family, partial [Sporomusa sp.]|nr:2-oxoacid:acceptor oxidoreductase, gamma subunit, pyruvate/2-ketoisovalerate family [Sporomusa sp.]
KKALETKLGDKFKQNPELRDMNFKALERGYQLIKSAM